MALVINPPAPARRGGTVAPGRVWVVSPRRLEENKVPQVCTAGV